MKVLLFPALHKYYKVLFSHYIHHSELHGILDFNTAGTIQLNIREMFDFYSYHH